MRKAVSRVLTTALVATNVAMISPKKTLANPIIAPGVPDVSINSKVEKVIFGLLAVLVVSETAQVTNVCMKLTKEAQITVIEAKIPWLPTKSEANSIMVKIHPRTGKAIQVRYYDENGNAKLDVDLYDHGTPQYHPWKYHKHRFVNGHRQPGEPLTDKETQYYIIEKHKTLMK